MLKINFLPESDLADFSKPIKEYENIWNDEGEKIVLAWEAVTGYSFKENFINASIHNRRGGHSHPLSLNSNKTVEEKKMHLVHELGHRILLPPRAVSFQKTKQQPTSLENHKIEYLVLYDVYEMIYGKDFADRAVAWDRTNLSQLIYGAAWDFALSFKTKEERQAKFKEMMAL